MLRAASGHQTIGRARAGLENRCATDAEASSRLRSYRRPGVQQTRAELAAQCGRPVRGVLDVSHAWEEESGEGDDGADHCRPDERGANAVNAAPTPATVSTASTASSSLPIP